MAKELSYEALLPALNGLKVRCMTQTELVGSSKQKGRRVPSVLIVERLRVPAIVVIGASFEIFRCREQPSLSSYCLAAGVAAGKSAHARSSPSGRRRPSAVFTAHNPTDRSASASGRALGGRSGERLLNRLGMPSSRHTLLREVIRGARGAASQPTVRILGVDDWAWSKGQSFGTILVNLERSEVVDLLPTRSAMLSVSGWPIIHKSWW